MAVASLMQTLSSKVELYVLGNYQTRLSLRTIPRSHVMAYLVLSELNLPTNVTSAFLRSISLRAKVFIPRGATLCGTVTATDCPIVENQPIPLIAKPTLVQVVAKPFLIVFYASDPAKVILTLFLTILAVSFVTSSLNC